MRIEGRRRSTNFEDRGRGSTAGGGGLAVQGLLGIVKRLGFKGTLIAGVLLGGAFLFLPTGVKQQLLAALAGGSMQGGASAGLACEASPTNAKACDFSKVVLASTEDVWTPLFVQGALPHYGSNAPSVYQHPTLVVFTGSVSTGGCGGATSAVGPFYCPGDKKLYIDPTFYDEMERVLKAPGDFAQAYVIAHEVGHHVQNLIGSTRVQVPGETKNKVSVRVEL